MALVDSQPPLRVRTQEYFRDLQDKLCTALENADGKTVFSEDVWTHAGGGGGRTRVLQAGNVFEKAGVNFSAVTSMLPEKLAGRLQVPAQHIFATGVSLVLHPVSPMVPTVHMNLRYLELEDGDAWFGGGTDLTPYYLYEEDAGHFHRTLKTLCERHNPEWYPRFKRSCDEYFFIKHRDEARGIGGIFFDYQRDHLEDFFEFIRDAGSGFLESYLPIVERRKSEVWGENEREWQRIRRGRYVEFNLVYDRGTLFGLETNGRTESILMSLPPEVRWVYDHQPKSGSRESELVRVLRHPKDWA